MTNVEKRAVVASARLDAYNAEARACSQGDWTPARMRAWKRWGRSEARYAAAVGRASREDMDRRMAAFIAHVERRAS